jgi:hypothetical protein
MLAKGSDTPAIPICRKKSRREKLCEGFRIIVDAESRSKMVLQTPNP